MPYDKLLSNRVREHLVYLPDVEEKEMFGGLVFMVNEKMCIGIMKEQNDAQTRSGKFNYIRR